MGLSHWVSRLIGSFAMGIAILLLISVFFIGAIVDQIDQLPVIVSETMDDFVEKHPDEVVAFFAKSGELESLWDICDQSEKSVQECQEELTALWIEENEEELRVEWTEELQNAFEPFKSVAKYSNMIWMGFVIFLLVGVIFILYGSKRDLQKAIRLAGWRIGIISIVPFIVLAYLARLDKEGIEIFITSQIDTIPGFLTTFLSLFAFTFFSPIIDRLLIFVLVLVIVGFGLWGGTYLLKIGQFVKRKIKK